MSEELLKKLRYKEGRAIILNAPEGFHLDIPGADKLEGTFDFVQLFTSSVIYWQDWYKACLSTAR
ncbi:hypothetical protein [Paenibacillus pinihumi]|uniref:hypothetical protein n=1 Tax=Paenibacillus pinihumi TaxID=669462 RepID=UPI0003F9FB26|nr:hypothetical protein [Paenibacillus pinihumi]